MDVDRSKQSIGKFCSSKDIDKSINKLRNTSNEILEVLEDHTSHKDKIKRKYGITKDPKNDYLLVFEYAKNGDLHDYLSKKFKEITWEQKIYSVYNISLG